MYSEWWSCCPSGEQKRVMRCSRRRSTRRRVRASHACDVGFCRARTLAREPAQPAATARRYLFSTATGKYSAQILLHGSYCGVSAKAKGSRHGGGQYGTRQLAAESAQSSRRRLFRVHAPAGAQHVAASWGQSHAAWPGRFFAVSRRLARPAAFPRHAWAPKAYIRARRLALAAAPPCRLRAAARERQPDTCIRSSTNHALSGAAKESGLRRGLAAACRVARTAAHAEAPAAASVEVCARKPETDGPCLIWAPDRQTIGVSVTRRPDRAALSSPPYSPRAARTREEWPPPAQCAMQRIKCKAASASASKPWPHPHGCSAVAVVAARRLQLRARRTPRATRASRRRSTRPVT